MNKAFSDALKVLCEIFLFSLLNASNFSSNVRLKLDRNSSNKFQIKAVNEVENRKLEEL